MPKLRVSAFSISLDGYGAGPDQDLENPLGVGGEALHEWLFETRTFRRMIGASGGNTGPNDDLAAQGLENVGAWIVGRNMFGPIRGPWPDDAWKGWWEEDPPYHAPVYVLTHHARDPLPMEGGTTFYFETEGIHAALERAREAAGSRDVRVGGGVSVIRQSLETAVLDELHLAVAPVILGRGENLFAGLDLDRLGFRVERHVEAPGALHVFLTRGSS